MGRQLEASAVKTLYWKPGEDYFSIISDAIRESLREGDVLVISEKALVIARGLIIDESQIKAGLLAKFLAVFWMRFVWGRLLSRICHLKRLTIRRLLSFPSDFGAAHKQLAIVVGGFHQALLHGSEGGIDTSNLPFLYASLPLPDPQHDARSIREFLEENLHVNPTVIIIDSDSTFRFTSLFFTSRPTAMRGIVGRLGLPAYLVGRTFKLDRSPTPLALSGRALSTVEAIEVARIAHKAMGHGAGRTAWDMAERFRVRVNEVTWEMLQNIDHYPICIVRKL